MIETDPLFKEAEEIYRRLNDKPRLKPEVGRKIKNPQNLRLVLGNALLFAQPVETESPYSYGVAKAVVSKMHPLLRAFFEGPWLPQEGIHGEIETNALLTMGLEPQPPLKKVNFGLQVAGQIARFTPGQRDVAETVVATIAGVGEKEVTIAYAKMAHLAILNDERDFADDAMLAMNSEEHGHLDFYRAFVRAKRERLSPVQQWEARTLYNLAAYPVGVQKGNTGRMQSFGRGLEDVAPGQAALHVAAQAEAVAADLLHIVYGEEGGPLQKGYQECLDSLAA